MPADNQPTTEIELLLLKSATPCTMVLIEKPPRLYFQTMDAIVALHFQSNVVRTGQKLAPVASGESWDTVDRIAAAAGTCVKLWAIRWPSSQGSYESCPNNTTEASATTTGLSPSRDVATETQNGDTADSSAVPSSTAPTETHACQIHCRPVCVIKEHAPHYIVGLRFNPTGNILASCDNHTVILSEFVRFIESPSSLPGSQRPTLDARDEVWRTVGKINESHSDIFDLCWHGNDKLLTGCINGVKIWSVRDQSLHEYVKFADGFVTGITAYGEKLIGAQSNDKRIVLWEKQNSLPTQHTSQPHYAPQQPRPCFSGYTKIIDDSESIALGPSDLPYYRRGSFDATGDFVAFPYGERGNQCFGVAYSLISPTNPPFRFRGHHLRVNCVAFSPVVWDAAVHCDAVLNGSSSESQKPCCDDPASSSTAHSIRTGNHLDRASPFTLYAQASVDGALSFWKVFYVGPDQLRADTLLILKPRFLDEQASVTDMTWTGDGMTLAVGADDGTITVVRFSSDEIRGTPRPNLLFAGVCHQPSSLSATPLVYPPRWYTFATPVTTDSTLPLPSHNINGSPEKASASYQSVLTTSPGELAGAASTTPSAISAEADSTANAGKKARRRVVPTLVSSVPCTSSEFSSM